MGDCSFPLNKKVREKYKFPVCETPTCEEECTTDHIEYLNEIYEDIQIILKQEKMNEQEIKQIIKPENGIETAIIGSADFVEGCSYGRPRSGHPEGQVIYHIKEVLENIDKFYGDDEDRKDLRLIAILHDTFKHKVDRTKPRTGENHHGMIARRFAEKFTSDTCILKLIELHDEAYNAWSMGGRRGDWYGAERRANQLIQGLLIEGSLDLYVKFFKCDNRTGDKEQENYDWFVNLIK